MEEKVTHLTLPSFLINKKDIFHIVRRTISPQEKLDYHDHEDYAEIFWIKEGKGKHLVNGHKISIEKGNLCMMRPNDAHTFEASSTSMGLVVTNIAFHKESLSVLKERYCPDSESYFWSKDELPYSVKLDIDQLNELSTATDYVLTKPRDYMNQDLLLLHILRILMKAVQNAEDMVPRWLQYALENYNTPQHFRSGIHGFVELTNRSLDHVNKTVKQHMNQTLTETLTKVKMNYAAQRLTMTNIPIKSICYNCGFNAIGHFYKVFNNYYRSKSK